MPMVESTHEAFFNAELGLIKLGGCMVSLDNLIYFCNDCKKDIFNKNLETKDSIIFEYFIEKLEEDCLLKYFDSKSGRVVYSKDKLENYDKTLKKTNEEVNQFFKDIMLVTKTWEESYSDSHILVGTQWNIKLDFMGLEDNLINS